MSESAFINQAPRAGVREKILPAVVVLAVVGLLFRPLLWHDVQMLRQAADSTNWINLGADALTFLIIAVALVVIVSGRIGAIAYNTFREAVRNRILYFILLFALVLMASSGVIRELAVSAHDRMIRNLGLMCVSFFGLMVAVFVGISLLYNELERKTIYTIVSKPVHRYQFLLGKYFGLLLTVYVIVAIMTVFFFAVLNYHAMTTDEKLLEVMTELRDDGYRHYVDDAAAKQMVYTFRCMAVGLGRGVLNVFGFMLSPEAVSGNILVVVGRTCLELMIVTGLAILFSSFTTPTLSAVFTVLTFIAGRLNEDILRFADRVLQNALKEGGAAQFGDLGAAVQVKVFLAQVAAHLVPNLDSLNVSDIAVKQGIAEVWRYPGLYALCYTICILSISVVVFHRRNFK